MMRVLIRDERVLPGLITASIPNSNQGRTGLLLGWINVKNSPQGNAENTSIQSGNNGYLPTIAPDAEIRLVTKPDTGTIGELSTLPKTTRERSWLYLFLKMIDVFAEARSVTVTTTLPPGSRPDLQPVSTITMMVIFPQMEANITLMCFNNRALTYVTLAKAWIDLCVRAARRDMWDNEETAEVI